MTRSSSTNLIVLKSLLTSKQELFVFNNSLSNLLEQDSNTLIFLQDLFDIVEDNNPLNEPVFFVSLFEFVNCFLYIYSPSSLINDPDKIEKRQALINSLSTTYLKNTNSFRIFINSYDKNSNEPILDIRDLSSINQSIINLRYLINPFSRLLKISIQIDDLNIEINSGLKIKPKVLSFNLSYKVKEPIDFLYKMIAIYNELVDIIFYNQD